MKFCRNHWSELRSAIESKGMGHLIKKTSEEAVEVVAKELSGKADIIDYDPLLSCYWQLSGECLKGGGLYLLGVDKDGNEYCPLCELDKYVPKERLMPGEILSTTWIQGCTNAALEYCKENGLVPIK